LLQNREEMNKLRNASSITGIDDPLGFLPRVWCPLI